MNRINYVFIDFENIQETELDRIANKPVKVALILGERHKLLPLSLVKLIQKYAAQVRLVETNLNGKNALDFVLACEIGAEAERDRSGYFHVLSRDKGFDAMIRHLKSKDVLAARHTAFSEIPVLMNAAERIKSLASRFKGNGTNRPLKRNTLESQIQAVFGKTLSPGEIEDTVQGLITEKIIVLSPKGEVAYKI
ncbi:MAG TPA: PIN domain-containing protein [Methylomirabilota bacterium]|nr:PIN domain-containing protein [Methylomirabilota bacterium]